MDLLTSPTGQPANLPWEVALLSSLLGFILSQCIAITYEKTYGGMSYSRSMFQTLALVSIISSMVIFAIGNNLARGIGIAGIFAIIRFRTNLRDPRDIVFVFASISVGIACGIKAYALAVTGALVFMTAAFYLRYIPLGSRQHYDGLLRFQMVPHPKLSETIHKLLRESCRRYTLITLKEISQGEKLEYAYQVKFRRSSHRDALVYMIREIEEIEKVSLMMVETTVEL